MIWTIDSRFEKSKNRSPGVPNQAGGLVSKASSLAKVASALKIFLRGQVRHFQKWGVLISLWVCFQTTVPAIADTASKVFDRNPDSFKSILALGFGFLETLETFRNPWNAPTFPVIFCQAFRHSATRGDRPKPAGGTAWNCRFVCYRCSQIGVFF